MNTRFSNLISDETNWELYLNGEKLKPGDELEVIRKGLVYWDKVIIVQQTLYGKDYQFTTLISCYLNDNYNIDSLLVSKL